MVSFCQSGLGSVGWSRVAVDAIQTSLLKRDFDVRRAARSSRLADAGRRCEAFVRVGVLTLLVMAGPVEARNILVPGGGATAAANAAASMATSVQQAQAITQQSINSLMGATAAIRAMQQAQNAAHNLLLSAPSAVPNGLVSGGLQVAPGVGTNPLVWQKYGTCRPNRTATGGPWLPSEQRHRKLYGRRPFQYRQNSTTLFRSERRLGVGWRRHVGSVDEYVETRQECRARSWAQSRPKARSTSLTPMAFFSADRAR